MYKIIPKELTKKLLELKLCQECQDLKYYIGSYYHFDGTECSKDLEDTMFYWVCTECGESTNPTTEEVS